MKQIRAETETHGRNGIAASPTSEMEMDDARSEASLDPLPIVPIAGAVHDTAEWQKTIEGVVKSVVSIHFCQTCSFDTDPAIASEATGFVVDAEKGYIMTNRVGCASSTEIHYVNPCSTSSALVPLLAIAYSTTTKNAMSTPYIATPSTISASYASTPQKSSTCP